MKMFMLAGAAALVVSSCTNSAGADANSTEAKEERNKQTALASVNSFSSGKADLVVANATDDVTDYGEGSMAPVKGRDSILAGLNAWMAGVPNYHGTDFTAVADGDYVMVYGTWSGTWKNDFMGMKATGRSFTVKDVDIFKFNEAGKIIERRSVQSNNEAARQLGMTLPSSTPQ